MYIIDSCVDIIRNYSGNHSYSYRKRPHGTGELSVVEILYQNIWDIVVPLRLRSLFIASFPLGLTLLFNVVYFHIDSIILTFTRTSAEVGIYGLAYKIFELPLVLPTFL